MGWDSDRDNPPSEAAVDENQLREDVSCETEERSSCVGRAGLSHFMLLSEDISIM